MLIKMQSINGRVRWKNSELKKKSIIYEIEKELLKLEGLVSIRNNYKAGSIALQYDSNISTKREFEYKSQLIICKFLKIDEKTSVNKYIKNYDYYPTRASLIFLALSIAFLAKKDKYLHAIFGYLFLLFISIHIFKHRKRLIIN